MSTYKRKRGRVVPRVRNSLKEGRQQEDQNSETQFLGFRLLNLPSSVILEILTRMPIKDVLNCRCACKSLCKLISDPYFAKHFISKSNLFSLLYRSTLGNYIRFAKLGDYDELGSDILEHTSSMPHIPHTYDLEVVGSSMGLLCLWNKSPLTNSLYITNPLLGEYAVLPKPLGDKHAAIDETYWFGCIPDTGNFKVVRIKVRRALLQSNPRKYHNKSEVQVLAIGTDKWEYVSDAPFPRHGKFSKNILHGRYLHWVVGNDKEPLQLLSFNLEANRVRSLSPPLRLGSEISTVELGVVGNCLGLIGCRSDRVHVEIWYMTDYGVASSWRKYTVLRIFRNPFLEPSITFWIDEEELNFLRYRGLLLSYHPKEKKYVESFNLGSTRKDDIWIYTPSFLSLTHLCQGARLRVKNTKSYFT